MGLYRLLRNLIEHMLMRRRDGYIVTGERRVEMFLGELGRDKADERGDKQRCHDRDGAGGGGGGEWREKVPEVDADAGDKACPDARSGCAFPE